MLYRCLLVMSQLLLLRSLRLCWGLPAVLASTCPHLGNPCTATMQGSGGLSLVVNSPFGPEMRIGGCSLSQFTSRGFLKIRGGKGSPRSVRAHLQDWALLSLHATLMSEKDHETQECHAL